MNDVLLGTSKAERVATWITPLRTSLYKLEAYIEQSPFKCFGYVTAIYTLVVLSLSSMKLLWLDELITLHIAHLSTVKAIWVALQSGADPNPPMTHLLVHLSRQIFGEHEWSLRLPAMIGYWVGCLALFLFLRRRISTIWSLTGVILSMSMGAFDYSYESRSYGIFYGLAMLALLLWSRTADNTLSARTRRISLAGMICALAAGVTTNYFAVLAFVPIAAGEVAYTLSYLGKQSSLEHFIVEKGWGIYPLSSGHAIRWTVWLSLIVSGSPLLFFRTLIAKSIAQFAPHAWNKVSLDQVVDSYMQMVDIVLYPLLMLMVFAGFILVIQYVAPERRQRLRPFWLNRVVHSYNAGRFAVPHHEGTAAFFMMAYPFLGYCLASIHGGMLSPRFVIPVCFGFAIAGALVGWRLFGSMPLAGTLALLVCSVWFLTRESVMGYWYMEQKQCFYKVIACLPEASRQVPQGAPLLIPDPLMALTFKHYASKEYSDRAVFPIDFAAIRFYRHDDSPEENLWAGRDTLYKLPIIPLAIFQEHAGPYLILASDNNWLVNDLEHHRYDVERLPINTRAGAIGGFTPLCRGVPTFYKSAGDAQFNGVIASPAAPDLFTLPGNLPSETLSSTN